VEEVVVLVLQNGVLWPMVVVWEPLERVVQVVVVVVVQVIQEGRVVEEGLVTVEAMVSAQV